MKESSFNFPIFLHLGKEKASSRLFWNQKWVIAFLKKNPKIKNKLANILTMNFEYTYFYIDLSRLISSHVPRLKLQSI